MARRLASLPTVTLAPSASSSVPKQCSFPAFSHTEAEGRIATSSPASFLAALQLPHWMISHNEWRNTHCEEPYVHVTVTPWLLAGFLEGEGAWCLVLNFSCSWGDMQFCNALKHDWQQVMRTLHLFVKYSQPWYGPFSALHLSRP